MCPRNCASSDALRGGKCCSGMEAQCTAFAPADTADSGNSGEQYPGAGELPANLGPVAGTKPTSNGPLRSGAQENACQFIVLQRNRVSALQHFHQTSNYVTLVTKPTLPPALLAPPRKRCSRLVSLSRHIPALPRTLYLPWTIYSMERSVRSTYLVQCPLCITIPWSVPVLAGGTCPVPRAAAAARAKNETKFPSAKPTGSGLFDALADACLVPLHKRLND